MSSLCPFDVNKLKFKVSLRSDMFELSYDEIADAFELVYGGVVVVGWVDCENSDRSS